MQAYPAGMTPGLPDLQDLALLVLVAETGSIGQAASRRGVAQPSVSRRIAALERNLGVLILRRTPRGSTLTPAGRALVDWALVLLTAAEDFSRSARALQVKAAEPDEVGTVRAGVSMTLAEHLAPTWLAELGLTAPHATVSFTVANSTEVSAMVESGELEIGFLESPTVRTALRSSTFGADRLVVAVHAGHPWAGRCPSLEELAGTPLLVREVGSGTRETIDRAFLEQGFRLRPALEMASNTALRAAAAAGLGPVVLSDLALAGDLATGRLVRVEVERLQLERPFTLVWRRGGTASPAARSLVAAVRRAEAARLLRAVVA